MNDELRLMYHFGLSKRVFSVELSFLACMYVCRVIFLLGFAYALRYTILAS